MIDGKELRLFDLLAAKICHDLSGPVGAIGNGGELIAESAGDPDEEVLDLVVESARQASRRLQFYRAALGTGNLLPETGRLSAAREVAQGFLGNGRIVLDWPNVSVDIDRVIGLSAVKMALNLLLVVAEIMPRGGRIRVMFGRNGQMVRISVAAIGPNIRFAEDYVSALGGRTALPDLSVKSFLPYLAHIRAAGAGGSIKVQPVSTGDGMEVLVELPEGA